VRPTDSLVTLEDFYFETKRGLFAILIVDHWELAVKSKGADLTYCNRQVNWADKALSVSLTKEAGQEQSQCCTDKPVSRQYEMEYFWLLRLLPALLGASGLWVYERVSGHVAYGRWPRSGPVSIPIPVEAERARLAARRRSAPK